MLPAILLDSHPSPDRPVGRLFLFVDDGRAVPAAGNSRRKSCAARTASDASRKALLGRRSFLFRHSRLLAERVCCHGRSCLYLDWDHRHSADLEPHCRTPLHAQVRSTHWLLASDGRGNIHNSGATGFAHLALAKSTGRALRDGLGRLHPAVSLGCDEKKR